MQDIEIFSPDIFEIYYDNGEYNITSKGELCLNFSMKSPKIKINVLEKCSSKGTQLLKLIEEFAIKIISNKFHY